MKTIKGLKIAALIPLAWMILVLLTFGIGESAGGDLSGLGHFVPVIFVVFVMWLGWKRPLWGGLLLLAGAAFQSLQFYTAGGGVRNWLPSLLIMILPLALSGLFLLGAAWMERRLR